MRWSRKFAIGLFVLAVPSSLSWAAVGAASGPPVGTRWPSLEKQLGTDGVRPGSALEGLIRANQNFSVLRADELHDKLGIPPWLRVFWRTQHPEAEYSATDPTGGYPRVIHEVYEWMLTHQDFRSGAPDVDRDPDLEKASVGGDLRASGAQSSARSESAISINPWAPSIVIASSNAITAGGAQAMFYSADGGATWGQTTLPLLTADKYHSDPTADWTSDGIGWSATIGIKGGQLHMRMYRSADSGKTWTFDDTFSGSQHNTDKEMIWVDHSASSPYTNNVYAIWHNGNPAFVNRRTAAGWGTPIQVSGSETSGTAIGGDIRTNAAGDVFAFWPATGNSRVLVAKSTTGGTSFAPASTIATTFDSYDIGVPAMASRRALIYVAGGAYRTSSSNLVYASWTDLTGESGCTVPSNEPGTNVGSACKTRIWFTRSTDGGTTWEAPRMVNNQASKNDQFNQWLAIDESNGTIGIIYYDTVADAGRLKTNVYCQVSTDSGVTWSAPLKVTGAQTDETVSGADSGNQYGDYNGLSGFLNRFLPSWTDRRNNQHEEIWTAPISTP
jgi:hypothetical protein